MSAIEFRRLDFGIKLRSGAQGRVSVIRDIGTPEARRRRAALHVYYAVLQWFARIGHVLCQRHRNKSHTCTTDYSEQEADEIAELWFTTEWVDDGTAVNVKKVIAVSGFPAVCASRNWTRRPPHRG